MLIAITKFVLTKTNSKFSFRIDVGKLLKKYKAI